MTDQPEEHLTATEARAGNSSNVNRVVLYVSMIAIVVIFAIIVLIAR